MSHHQPENTSPTQPTKLIDVEKIIGGKNPKLLKILPNFLIKYIKRKIHEDELNEAVSRNSHLYHLDFVATAMQEFGVKAKVIGEENIPKEDGAIMSANHPLGGLDALALISVVGKYRSDIRFLVNDVLMVLKNFGSIFVPVNKHGRNSASYLDTIDKVFASKDCVLIFPAGLVSRRQERRVIKDLVWKKSFITKSVQYKKDIVPVFIDGKNSNFFYNLAYWRKKIGIKANIEMFFLVDEMYKQKGKTLTFIFGEPISWQTFTDDHPDEYWAGKVKEHVYALGSGDKSKMLPTLKKEQIKN